MNDKNKSEEDKIIYEKEQAGDFGDDLDGVEEKINKLKEKLKKCSKEKEEYLDGWQRAKAEMVNYRRRQEEQMEQWQKLVNEGLIVELLPVLDSLNQSLEAGIEGVIMIRQQLWDIFKKHGLEEIRAVGEKFNPEFHEAVETVELDKEEGIVIEEVQRGYLLNGKVIRIAKVKVTRKL